MDESTKSRPAPRLQLAERHQIVFRAASLDLLVSQDHPVRAVWEFVEQADLTSLYEAIRAVEGAPGRPPIDPKILLALWLYATLDGVGSARELDRLTREHQVYQWFAMNKAIDEVAAAPYACTVYGPVQKPKDPTRDPHLPRDDDSPVVAAWRVRMGTAAARAIYKLRAQTAECVNAIARNRGLTQFRVRGLRKAKAIALWFALAHNTIRTLALLPA